MKNYILLALSLLGLASLFAYPVRIQSWNLDQDVKQIIALNISIDSVTRHNGTIIAYVRNDTEYDLLKSLGLDAQRIPDPSREYYEQLRDTAWKSNTLINEYYSIPQYINFMQTRASSFPNICHLEQYGTSIQGNPLYFMKISDNVTVNEAEPEVKLVASIHGDETVGYVMMLRLIKHLTENYNIDPVITELVNNTELWIAPLMNPDGYVNGERYNAAGIDLNRNFPMPNGITNPDGYPTATENVAMMDFSQDHNFCIGINFHGGALVLNYPWDYTHALTPDNQMIIDMSLTYSSQNLPMYNSNEFDNGITNGAAWYVITGSMQDWNYGFTNNIELTAEISSIKWPNTSTLDGYWDDNRQSILDFIAYAQNGIKGTVTDSDGSPLPATISIIGNDKDICNDTTIGDYHRILLPGTYTIQASSPGYIPQTAVLTVPASGSIEHNFVLPQASIMNISGIVRDISGFINPEATIMIMTDPQILLQSDANGCFYLENIPEGDYEVSAIGCGGVFHRTLQLRKHGEEDLVTLVLQPPIFNDDFENGIINWNVTGNWGIVQEDGSSVLTDSPSGNYSSNQNIPVSLVSAVSLQNIDTPQLQFRAKWNLESGYDFVYVEASSDGNNWDQLDAITGNQPDWINLTYSLDAYTNGFMFLRFRFVSDWSQTGDGIYIDDLIITGTDTGEPILGDVNLDGVISPADVQAVLDYSVGGNLRAAQLINANTDLLQGVKTLDAFNILRYMKDSNYLFPPQDPLSPILPEAEINPFMEGDNLQIGLSDELRSLHINIPYGIQDPTIIPPDTPYYVAINQEDGLLSYIAYAFVPEQDISVALQNPESNFNLLAEINGFDAEIEVHPSDSAEITIPGPQLTLCQNYPNPFNPSTTISFSLPDAGPASLKIYNTKGQLVRRLLDTNLNPGTHSLVWDGMDTNSNAVGSGIYLYRLKTGKQTICRKMVLSK
ncbi:MAG: M14 family zinc carboxypeptidase [Candidatus Cloacimonetes bacterium]|nr:M14 family zinc carboxypeptidase [Candidatus Cloacimonadota bacterium]